MSRLNLATRTIQRGTVVAVLAIMAALGVSLPVLGQGHSGVPIWNEPTLSGIEFQASDQGCVKTSDCLPGCSADSLRFFAGLEGSKQPQDFGVNANFGGRISLEWERLIIPEIQLGLQIGTALVGSENAVQVFERVAGDSSRLQSFTTIGLNQSLPSGLRYGVVYDVLYQDSYDRFVLSQFRTQVGVEIVPDWETGIRATVPTRGANGVFNGINVRLDPLAQGSVYLRRYFENGSMLGGWAGMSEGHSEANLALGDLPRTKNRFLYGAELRAPFNECFAIFGQANFISPSDTGTVDAFLGLEFTIPSPLCRHRYRQSMPFIPVAGSPTFSVDLNR